MRLLAVPVPLPLPSSSCTRPFWSVDLVPCLADDSMCVRSLKKTTNDICFETPQRFRLPPTQSGAVVTQLHEASKRMLLIFA